MKITREFLDANAALYSRDAFRNVDPSRLSLVSDIQSRAREIASCRVGQELRSFEISILQQLRSRLEDYCIVTFTAAQNWLDAFGNAYRA